MSDVSSFRSGIHQSPLGKTNKQENYKQIKAIKCNLKCLKEMKPSPTTCYFSIGVLLQMCVQHGIADLVTNLVCREKTFFW